MTKATESDAKASDPGVSSLLEVRRTLLIGGVGFFLAGIVMIEVFQHVYSGGLTLGVGAGLLIALGLIFIDAKRN